MYHNNCNLTTTRRHLLAGAHIHLMGICGTAMASLAGLLKQQGYRITGSDQNIYPPMSTMLESLGISVMPGYRKENLNPPPDLVIVGNVITRKHEEAQALLESNIAYTSLPEALGEFVIAHRQSFVVAGTHGKTTTTSLLAWIADQCQLKPGFLIGGIAKNFSRSFQQPEGDLFIIEGDEYDTAFFDKVPKFVHYKPRYAILTSIEMDHIDIYPKFSDVVAAFDRFIELIEKDGLLVVCAQDDRVLKAAQKCRSQVVTYGMDRGQYQARNIQSTLLGAQFDLLKAEKKIANIQTQLYGRYNLLNVMAAVALGLELGWPHNKVISAVGTFCGVKRRQEIVSVSAGVTLIEDFAHHPTAVKETTQAIMQRYGSEEKRKIYFVFEPRSATSRRSIFQKDYVEAFKSVHHVIIAEAFDQSRILVEDRFSSQKLVDDLMALGVDARLIPTVDEMVSYLYEKVRPSDVVVIMSNGGLSGQFCDRFSKSFK